MNSREKFLSNNDDATGALAITRSDLFQKMVTYSIAYFSETMTPTKEQLEGAVKFVDILVELAEPDVISHKPLTSGLTYDFSAKPKQTP